MKIRHGNDEQINKCIVLHTFGKIISKIKIVTKNQKTNRIKISNFRSKFMTQRQKSFYVSMTTEVFIIFFLTKITNQFVNKLSQPHFQRKNSRLLTIDKINPLLLKNHMMPIYFVNNVRSFKDSDSQCYHIYENFSYEYNQYPRTGTLTDVNIPDIV